MRTEHVEGLRGSQHLFDLQSGFERGGVVEVGLHALIFIVAETIANVLGEVGVNEVRGKAALGGLPGDDGGDVAFAIIEGFEEMLGIGGGNESGMAAPDGEDHGQAGEFLPFLAEVESEKRENGGVEVERGIADDESGVVVGEHFDEDGFGDGDSGVRVEFTAEDDAGEHDGSARAAVDGEGADFARRYFGNKEDGADGAIAGDADAGYIGEGLTGHLDDGEQSNVGQAGLDAVGAFGGKAVVQEKRVAPAAVFQAPNKGDRIEIRNHGDAWASGVGMHLNKTSDCIHFSVAAGACHG